MLPYLSLHLIARLLLARQSVPVFPEYLEIQLILGYLEHLALQLHLAHPVIQLFLVSPLFLEFLELLGHPEHQLHLAHLADLEYLEHPANQLLLAHLARLEHLENLGCLAHQYLHELLGFPEYLVFLGTLLGLVRLEYPEYLANLLGLAHLADRFHLWLQLLRYSSLRPIDQWALAFLSVQFHLLNQLMLPFQALPEFLALQ